jgi:hypothetical protein
MVTRTSSYEPEPAFYTWWERNRVRAVVIAAIVLLGLLAFVVPDSLKGPATSDLLIDGPEQ